MDKNGRRSFFCFGSANLSSLITPAMRPFNITLFAASRIKSAAATSTDEIRLHLATEKLSSRHVGDRCADQKLAQYQASAFSTPKPASFARTSVPRPRMAMSGQNAGGRCVSSARRSANAAALPFQGDLTTTFECTNCREMELNFSSARSAVVAKTVVLEAIHRFKYSHALWFENFLADLLIPRSRAGVARTGVEFHRARAAPSVERARTGIQSRPKSSPRHLSAATNIPLNTRAAPADFTHDDANPPDQTTTRGKTYAERLRFIPA